MTEANRSATPAWHALDATAVVARITTDPERSLSTQEAHDRLDQHGPNRLAEAPPPHPLLRFARQFDHLLIYVMIGAAGVTALLAHWVDTGVIIAVVLLNAVIGFLQEGEAERSLQAVRHMLAPRAQVLRDGHPYEVDAVAPVPGDMVLLASGDRVPADVRLLNWGWLPRSSPSGPGGAATRRPTCSWPRWGSRWRRSRKDCQRS